MPATVIAERIGWERSLRVLRDRGAELRQAYLPRDPASRTAQAVVFAEGATVVHQDVPRGKVRSAAPYRVIRST